MGLIESGARFRYETPSEKDWEINERFGIFIHNDARIGQECKLGRNVVIHEGVILGKGVVIGDNVVIHAGTVIDDETEILGNVDLGMPPRISGSITRQLKEEYPNLVIGKHCLIGPMVKIYRGTSIGDDTSVYEFTTVREECQIGNSVVLAPGVTVNYGVAIGNNVRVMHSSHLTGGMVIEADVFISLHVGSTNDSMIEGTEEKEDRWKGAIIRRGAVIGAGVMLAPGVEIGEKCHVAMLSTVTRNIPPNTHAAGSPARVVPHR